MHRTRRVYWFVNHRYITVFARDHGIETPAAAARMAGEPVDTRGRKEPRQEGDDDSVLRQG